MERDCDSYRQRNNTERREADRKAERAGQRQRWRYRSCARKILCECKASNGFSRISKAVRVKTEIEARRERHQAMRQQNKE